MSVSLLSATLHLKLMLLQSIKILNMIKVYGKPIRVNKSSQDKRSQDVGANLFIGNLDPDVDEKVGATFACHCSNRLLDT